jgi:hypothetical protein
MRHALIGLLFAGATVVSAPANAAVDVSIGLNVPAYPSLVQIPSYPVYYAPSLRADYFFYDGLFWVFSNGTWYESQWYNGPWYAVDPYNVPVYLLRVPVRYYRVRPSFFLSDWSYDSAPRWDSYWGRSWSSRRSGWDHWNRASAPAAAPLPTYQRSYSGSRYPSNTSQQQTITSRSYSYRPHEAVAQRVVSAPAQRTVIPAQAGNQPRATQNFASRETSAQSRRGVNSVQTQRQAQAQSQQAQAQAQARTESIRARSQQAQVQQQQRVQSQERVQTQQRVQQAQAQQRQERAQQPVRAPQMERQQRPEPQRQAQAERPQPQQQRAQPQQQHESRGQQQNNRGQDHGNGKDKKENG